MSTIKKKKAELTASVFTLDLRLARLGRSYLAHQQTLCLGIQSIRRRKGLATLDWLSHDHHNIRKTRAHQAHHPAQAADHRCRFGSL